MEPPASFASLTVSKDPETTARKIQRDSKANGGSGPKSTSKETARGVAAATAAVGLAVPTTSQLSGSAGAAPVKRWTTAVFHAPESAIAPPSPSASTI